MRHILRKVNRKKSKIFLKRAGLGNLATELCSKISLFDIGASYFFAANWTKLLQYKPSEIFLVDPNENTLDYLSNLPKNLNINRISSAISRTGGKQVFYKTNVISGSSLLEPDLDLILSNKTPAKIKDYFLPIEEILIDTISTSELLNKSLAKSKFLKIDIQGYELELLKGASEFLENGNLILIELETSTLSHRYMKNSSSLKEIVGFMESFGYNVLEIVPIYSEFADSAGRSHKSYLNECDIAFIADANNVKFRNSQSLEAIFLAYLVYGFTGMALSMLENDHDLINDFESRGINLDKLKEFIAKDNFL